MPTQNSWNNQVINAAVTLNGGVTSIGTDAASNAINIGTGGAAKTLTLGNITGATAVNINTGTGGTAITTTNGTMAIATGTGAINIGTDAVAKTVTVGNTTGASVLALKYGTGDFTLESATGTVISALDTGEITKPLQPAFLAYKSATTNDVTGDGTIYTILFNTVVFDQGSDYTAGSGTFTAPVTGRYQFNFSAGVGGMSAGHTLGELRITTSNRTYDTQAFNWYPSFTSANQFVTSFSICADMDAADTALFQIAISYSTKTVDLFGNALCVTSASGYLVC